MTDKINVNTIVPAGNTLTLGASGGSVAMTDDVKVNTIKDAGANTLWVSDGSGNLSSVNSGFGGAQKLLATTADVGMVLLVFHLQLGLLLLMTNIFLSFLI